jgi:hypothetical protein
MSFPRKIWLHFICRKIDANSYTTLYYEDGVVKESTLPKPLPQHPQGWKDIEVAFGTNQKYFSLNRSFSVPLKYVNDGADILRYCYYKGKGYEEELYAVIGRWNRDTGIVELEYRAKIDLLKFEDNPVEGVTVNTIEGGVLSYLSSRDSTSYEIVCDETNPKTIKVQFDGINLVDKFNYSVIPTVALADANDFRHSVPSVFLNNEGDSVGIAFGSEDYGSFPNVSPSFDNLAGYIFKPLLSAVSIRLFGTYKVQLVGTTHDGTYSLHYIIGTGTSSAQTILGTQAFIGDGVLEFTFDVTINLNQNEALYLEGEYNNSGSTSGNDFNILESNFSISFISKNPNSTAYGLFYYDYMQQLVQKMTDNRFTLDSDFFRDKKDLVVTCGDALRNTDKTSANTPIKNYIISASFSDAFQSGSSIYDLGIKVIDDVIWIEPKTDLYNDDTQIFDLGEINELKISTAEEYLINTVNVGYPDQRYDQRNGKFEFNSTQQYLLPVTAVNKALDLTSKFRADSFGIEFIRGLANSDTTDNLGDKTPFFVVVDENGSISTFDLDATKNPQIGISNGKIQFDTITNNGGSEAYLSVNSAKTDFTYIFASTLSFSIQATVYGNISGSGTGTFNLKLNGSVIATDSVPATQGFFRIGFDMVENLSTGDVVTIEYSGSPVVDITSAGLDIISNSIAPIFTYNLKRVAYDSITGVTDNTVYNVEISPKRMLLNHGAYLKSLLYQLQDQKITFQTGAKNTQLSTTKDGVTIAESADVQVMSLQDPIFIPYILEFKAPSPYTFAQTLSQLGTGYIKGTFNGYPVYGLPIGEMKAKPASDEVQTWKLLAAPNNNLNTLLQLQSISLFILNMDAYLKILNICPVHFVKYNFTPNSKYHHKDIYDDWADERFNDFLYLPKNYNNSYLQKWQKNDVIKIPVITAGLGQLTLYVYDKDGKDYTSILFDIITDSVIQTPHTSQMCTVNLTDFDEGEYLFVIKAGSTALAVSEWQSVKVDQGINCFLFEFSNTYNKLNYFTTWGTLSLRSEAWFHPWEPDSSFVDYEDEPGDIELLNGIPSLKRTLELGEGQGVPEYMIMKLNEILLLNRVNIENAQYVRLPDSKFNITKPEDKGYPFYYASIDVKKAINDTGLVLDETGIEIPRPMVAYTLDAQMFGDGSGVINIEVQDE